MAVLDCMNKLSYWFFENELLPNQPRVLFATEAQSKSCQQQVALVR